MDYLSLVNIPRWLTMISYLLLVTTARLPSRDCVACYPVLTVLVALDVGRLVLRPVTLLCRNVNVLNRLISSVMTMLRPVDV